MTLTTTTIEAQPPKVNVATKYGLFIVGGADCCANPDCAGNLPPAMVIYLRGGAEPHPALLLPFDVIDTFCATLQAFAARHRGQVA